MGGDKYLRTSEVALEVGCCRETVRQAVKRGDLHVHHRVGKQRHARFARNAVEAWKERYWSAEQAA